jgi:hypothetical protein
MQKILNVLVALVALICLALWAQWMFAFESVTQQWAVIPDGVVGKNNLRGDIGGLFLATAAFCALYFRYGPTWLRAGAVTMGCVLLCRIASVAMDGFAPPVAVSMAIELVFISVFLAAAATSNRPSA